MLGLYCYCTTLPSGHHTLHRDTFDIAFFLQPTATRDFSYRVKILNPHLKRDTIVRDVRKLQRRFESIIDMKVRLMDEFGEQIPPSTNFSVGYFAGRPLVKYWIYTTDDLRMMYVNCPTTDIMLWCDGNSEDIETPKSKRKKKEEVFLSKREDKENKMEELAEELKELNGDKFSEMQYRLWARMIVNGIHSSKETPPQIPLITGVTPKRRNKFDEERKFLQESIVSTAAAVVKAVNNGSTIVQSPSIQQTVQDPSTDPSTSLNSQLGVSPAKAAEIRGKSFGQLSVLKQLYDDNVLTQEEFQDQKNVILSHLKKLQ